MTALLLSNLFAWSMQVAVLVTAALLVVRLVRLEAPVVRYLFFRGVLVLCLLLPIVQPRLSVVLPSVGAAAVDAVNAAAVAPQPPGQPTGFLTGSIHWPFAIGIILAAGMLARLLWITTGVVRLHRLRRVGDVAAPTDDHLELQRLITTRATIRYVRRLGQPVTFGFRRPVILLPYSLREEAAPIQRAVLAHELWHVRRADWLWTVAEEALRAVCWFHPAIWALLSEIQATREEVVDELTILTTGSRRTYVDALLVFADKSPWFAATAFARRRHLIHRLVLISKEAVMSARRVVMSCAALAVVVVSTGWYAVQAFPLKQAGANAEVMSTTIGPVEQRARPITPENPIPRRMNFVPADYPQEAASAGARGLVTVRLAVDETGQVAETRIVGLSLQWKDGSMNVTGIGPETLERFMLGSSNAQTARPIVEAITAAVTRAVRQWHYAPPADGPIAFSIGLNVGPPPPPPPPPAYATSPRPGMPPPPPPAPSDSGTTAFSGDAVRVGGNIKVPTKLRNVNPVYPMEAQVNKVQGVVIIEARIEADGTVSQARVLRSIPMLDDAAVEAVRQWQFTPTLLNGQPVPVIMTTTVNFTLQ